MAARSSLTRAVLLALPLAGCDAVFGLDGEIDPCELGSFADVTPVDLVEAVEFSVDREMTFGVITMRGAYLELDLATNALTPIELGPYATNSLALTPEGDALLYTALHEPPILRGALRGGVAEWKLDAEVPRATLAGTPSADAFGPRRMLVKARPNDTTIVEYEDVQGTWTAIREPQPHFALRPPHLTPDGLTMVYGDPEGEQPAVYAAQRTSTSEWFGEPRPLLAGTFLSAQLLGQCKTLFASDGSMLRRYDR